MSWRLAHPTALHQHVGAAPIRAGARVARDTSVCLSLRVSACAPPPCVCVRGGWERREVGGGMQSGDTLWAWAWARVQVRVWVPEGLGKAGMRNFRFHRRPPLFPWPSLLPAGRLQSVTVRVINSDYGIKLLRVHFWPDCGIASIFIAAEANNAWNGAQAGCSAALLTPVMAS